MNELRLKNHPPCPIECGKLDAATHYIEQLVSSEIMKPISNDKTGEQKTAYRKLMRKPKGESVVRKSFNKAEKKE